MPYNWKDALANIAKKLNDNISKLASNKAENSDLKATNSVVSKNTSDIALQSARIDGLAKLTNGSTTGDAELIDGRTDASGITHNNIGGHIRDITNSINSDIDIHGNMLGNLRIKFNDLENGKIDDSGNNVTDSVSARTGYRQYLQGQIVNLIQNNAYLHVYEYDANKVFVSGTDYGNKNKCSFAANENHYYRFTILATDWTTPITKSNISNYLTGSITFASALQINLENKISIGTAELVDGRKDINGVSHTNIGAHIRDITTSINSDMDAYGNILGNLRVKFADLENGKISDTGADVADSVSARTGYRQFSKNQIVNLVQNNAYLNVYEYDSSKVFISKTDYGNNLKCSFSVDETHYYRFSILASNWTTPITKANVASYLTGTITFTPTFQASLETKITKNKDALHDGLRYIDLTLVSGGIDNTSGSFTVDATFMRTDKTSFDGYGSITINTPSKYTSLYYWDTSGIFKGCMFNTVRSLTFTPIAGYKYAIQFWYGGSDKNLLSTNHTVSEKIILTENDTYRFQKPTNCLLDLPTKLFIQKGGTLELFKYGMYYTDTEYVPDKYNIRVANINQYRTEYSDKIIISCPSDYAGITLRNSGDLPLFQLLDRYGNVVDQKRVTIYVADQSAITNIARNIMYLGDSLTGMGYRSGETARLLSLTNLTNTKLIGRSIGNGTGNKFTGTGGYSWANYTEDPSTLPAGYPNNYLWDATNSKLSMKYHINSLGETQLDYIIILLGWNDYESGAFASSFSWDTMKVRAKKLIENIHLYYPSCKIILESYHYMYPLYRKSYGNTMPQIRQNKYIYDLNRFYQGIADGYDYVEFLQMSCQIDVIHNMTLAEEVANKRTTETVKYCTDTVHPADIGFFQYSDAEFATLLYLMRS